MNTSNRNLVAREQLRNFTMLDEQMGIWSVDGISYQPQTR